MEGEFDPFTEEILPPPSSIDQPPHDPEPGVRHETALMGFELDLVDRQTPDAPRRRSEQPRPRADRAEDMLQRRGTAPKDDSPSFPGLLEWNDDGAWDDMFGLDVIESF